MTFEERKEQREHDYATAIARNMAENGRWGVLAMVACSIASGNATMAFLFALTLFWAYVAELLDDPYRAFAQLSVVAWTIMLLLIYVAVLWF